jgi:hypothetical protein
MNKKQSIPMLFSALQEVEKLKEEIEYLKTSLQTTTSYHTSRYELIEEENNKMKNDLRLCADGLIPHGMVGGIVETEREKRQKAEEENKKLEERYEKLRQQYEDVCEERNARWSQEQVEEKIYELKVENRKLKDKIEHFKHVLNED